MNTNYKTLEEQFNRVFTRRSNAFKTTYPQPIRDEHAYEKWVDTYNEYINTDPEINAALKRLQNHPDNKLLENCLPF